MTDELTPPFEGGCQCGAIRYRCSRPPFVTTPAIARPARSSPAARFITCIQVPAEGLEVLSGEPALRERPCDSGNRLTTAFCPTCSSALCAQNSARTAAAHDLRRARSTTPAPFG
jgi:hypothetical protein